MSQFDKVLVGGGKLLLAIDLFDLRPFQQDQPFALGQCGCQRVIGGPKRGDRRQDGELCRRNGWLRVRGSRAPEDQHH